MRKIIKIAHYFSIFLLIPLIVSTIFVQSVNINVPSSQEIKGSENIQMNLWLTCNGNDIQGSETVAGREGSIKVLGYHHLVSGSLSGHHQHSPLRITKLVDKSSPLLMKALLSNEICDPVILRFYKINPVTLILEEYYTISLQDARIIEIGSYAQDGGDFVESVAFIYTRITWVWPEDGTEYEGHWDDPVV
jgi:type VI secretion system secreted protein Hcp